MDALATVAEKLAEGNVPPAVAQALAQARLTALQKPGGAGVRGIATGDTLRRLVARTLAQQFGTAISRACAPYQFTLSTRAGTDAAAHLLRAATDLRGDATIVALDGIGAYDHVVRAEFFATLLHNAALAPLMPYARLFYAQDSTYVWYDDAGVAHEVRQGEGVEQGDALAPALFSLALHRALRVAEERLEHGEVLVAFLDDVYLLTRPERAREAFDSVTDAIATHAGIQTHLGKCRVWNAQGGPAPPGIGDLGPDVWRGDQEPENRGLIILGTPLGTPEFIRSQAQHRVETEESFLHWLPRLPDLQSAWLLLLFCASPRANHLLRSLPPTLARPYAEAHDALMWTSLQRLLAFPPSRPEQARNLATLPGKLGGLGLRAATRTSPAAYWAAWADTLEVLKERRPAEAAAILAQLEREGGPEAACLREAHEAAARLDEEGFAEAGAGPRPQWRALFAGERPPPPVAPEDSEPGQWNHGWQYYASSTRETYYKEHQVFPALSRSARATVRSGSGPQAAAWLTALPTSPATTMSPVLFQLALRRRLRLPLLLSARRCKARRCSARLGKYDDHRLACAITGRLRRRAKPIELAWSSVFAEAGAVVADQVLLRDTNVPVDPADSRQLDFVAWGLRGFGLPVCGDATIVSPLHRDGTPWAGAPDMDGASFTRALRAKEAAYPELAAANPYGKLTVLACETGGRWHDTARGMVSQLVNTRVLNVPPLLRRAARLAYHRRWWCLLSVALQRTVATSLLDHPGLGCVPGTGPAPPLGDVLHEALEMVEFSRLPLHQ